MRILEDRGWEIQVSEERKHWRKWRQRVKHKELQNIDSEAEIEQAFKRDGDKPSTAVDLQKQTHGQPDRRTDIQTD